MSIVMRSRLLVGIGVALGLFLLTGCISLMQERRVGEPQRTEQPVMSRMVGTPRVAFAAHTDGLGWMVTGEMQVERTIIHREVQQWQGHRYVSSPFSVFAGLFQCPVGLIHLFSNNPSNNVLRHGCARLVMFEPLDGVTPLPATNVSRLEMARAWEVLQEGVLEVSVAGRPQQAVHYALSKEGQTDVRFTDLLSRLVISGTPIHVSQAQPVTVRLHYGDGSFIEEHRTIDVPQLQQSVRSLRHALPSEEWPTPPIMQVRMDPASISPAEAESIRSRIQRHMLKRRLCVVTEGLQAHVLDELGVQYSGLVDEATQVRLGKLLAPSIVVVASAARSADASDTTRKMTIELRDVREGKILATASGTTRSGMLVHALERTLTELDLLMAKAPRTGCPG